MTNSFGNTGNRIVFSSLRVTPMEAGPGLPLDAPSVFIIILLIF
ncbi:hypothetical protein C1G86_0317 [Dehalococcoides mccartyi]|uniref:Uncharacterized protein n=1 Tax=Dehalococcoides mccartyi TaxID=61435 RepID=A0A328EPV9_9CHLR|nr:hypothetical protein C1G86_0317 [Dehalococcoides mccartyi]